MPKMFISKGVDTTPKIGDRYVVVAIYPGTTDDLFRPRIEVVLELERKDDKGEQK